jgi:hypothetical protein
MQLDVYSCGVRIRKLTRFMIGFSVPGTIDATCKAAQLWRILVDQHVLILVSFQCTSISRSFRQSECQPGLRSRSNRKMTLLRGSQFSRTYHDGAGSTEGRASRAGTGGDGAGIDRDPGNVLQAEFSVDLCTIGAVPCEPFVFRM